MKQPTLTEECQRKRWRLLPPRPHGARITPHNWGSVAGYDGELHVGRAVSNFCRAEHDPLVTDALVAKGYQLQEALSLGEAPQCSVWAALRISPGRPVNRGWMRR